MDVIDGRGILYPTELPFFRRVPAPAELSDLIRWFWVPRWCLVPGRMTRQVLLPFPASNLVIEPTGVWIAGPTTGASYRNLHDRGWAAGALLRPAGIAALRMDPRTIRDRQVRFDAPDLHRAVAATMHQEDDLAACSDAVAAFSRWASEHLATPDEDALFTNSMEDSIAADRTIIRVQQLADLLCITIRGVQRLAHRYIGVTPLAVIRRYRLQEAAQRLRQDPSQTITQLAADLGYADHAHLCADFRRVLGLTPNSYRHHPTHAP